MVFTGAFSGPPGGAGVIQCEMLAQTCCVLMGEAMKGRIPLFAGMDGVRFKGMVCPGDTLEFVCALEKLKGPFFFAKGKGFVGQRLCVEGSFTFALMEDR